MKKGQAFIALVLVIAALCGLGYVAFHGIGNARDGSIHSVDLGLDLAGGVSITYGVVGDETPSATDVSDTVEKLRRRVESYSTEAQVYTEAGNRINIEIPGVNDANQILSELGQPGNLYFISQTDADGEENYYYGLVYDESALTDNLIISEGTEEELTDDAVTEEETTGEETTEEGTTEEGTTEDETTGEETEGEADGEGEGEEVEIDYSGMRIAYVLNNKTIDDLIADGSVVIDGTHIETAEVGTRTNSFNQNEFVVQLTLNKEGTEKFAAATQKAYDAGETIAIYYDGEIISAPSVNAVISDGTAIIEGSFTMEDANSLATIIRIGGLKLQLEELRSNVVGAQLGQDAIRSSLVAAAVGFGALVLFMIVIYLILGLSASIALGFYVCLVIIFLDGLKITLTLPGIAGIILSIGMAVDANVLVFTRIREEITGGKTVREAMKAGYSKALSGILDGNITTMIAAIVLGFLGSGPVKGFAYTLALGICLSMVTALFITRGISLILYYLGCKSETLYGKQKERGVIDFIGKRKIFYGISLAMIAIGIIAMIIGASSGRGAMNFSLDFVGGTSTTVTFDEAYTLEELDATVVPRIREVTGVSTVQTQTVAGTNEVIFKTVTLSADQRVAMDEMLEEEFAVANENIAAETISATISQEMTRSAVIAIIVALVLILLYIRIRFRDITFGISAVIALAHDALIVIACYALTRIEVGSTFVAVVLTIIGYSINDTIVTFDRLRENKKNDVRKQGREELVNRSVTQTMSRALFTSITTFLMVLSLFIFGVTDIRNFSLPLMVGVICGTYSSICLASSLWYDMKRMQKQQ